MWLFFARPWCRALPVCCSGIFEWFLDGPDCFCCFLRHFYCYILHALYFCCKVFILQDLLSLSLDHIHINWNCSIYWHSCSFSIITCCDIWFNIYERFGRFALVDSVIYLPYFQDLFLIILVHPHTSVHCLISPLISLHTLNCIWPPTLSLANIGNYYYYHYHYHHHHHHWWWW